MAGGAESTSSAAKRAKKDKEDPLVRRREELILEVANARVAMKARFDIKAVREAIMSLQVLRGACADIEAENLNELLKKLPEELWSKIVDENVQQNDVVALAMTCRFFREKQKDLGWKLETNLDYSRLLELRESGKMASHTLGWFQWVCDTFEIRPGFKEWSYERVKGAVYEGDLVNYAALQGSVEILRWLMEEKGWELNEETGEWAGRGGSVEVLEYTAEAGYTVDGSVGAEGACGGAAEEGHLEALKFLRGLDPPCPWDEGTCAAAARKGHLDVLMWARDQDPPCPWDDSTCLEAAWKGRLDVLKWARAQNPPCPWNDRTCSHAAYGGHLDVLMWARSQDPPCPWWGAMTCSFAAGEGHLEVLKWARSQGPPCPWDKQTCSSAAGGGHLDVLKWARSQDPPCPWDEGTCSQAAGGGHLDVLMWARSQTPPCPWDKRTCFMAARGGHLDVLKFLRSQDPPCPWDEESCQWAVREGKLEALKWLRAQNPPCPWSSHECRADASKSRHWHIVKWIDQQED